MGGEGAEIADSRDFVIRELDAKMILEAREQLESLQAVDTQFLEEIIIGMKFRARDFEVRRSEIQDLIGCLFNRLHNCLYSTGRKGLPNTAVSRFPVVAQFPTCRLQRRGIVPFDI